MKWPKYKGLHFLEMVVWISVGSARRATLDKFSPHMIFPVFRTTGALLASWVFGATARDWFEVFVALFCWCFIGTKIWHFLFLVIALAR